MKSYVLRTVCHVLTYILVTSVLLLISLMLMTLAVKWMKLLVMESSWEQMVARLVLPTVYLVLMSKFVLLVKKIMSLTG